MKPWVVGSLGTPWNFTTLQLVKIGNDSLLPDSVVDEDGDLKRVYLTPEDVIEAMAELNFNSCWFNDPLSGLAIAWEVELLPSVVL